jgi:hypothetical protein
MIMSCGTVQNDYDIQTLTNKLATLAGPTRPCSDSYYSWNKANTNVLL